MSERNIYEQGLDQVAANYEPLSPLTFLSVPLQYTRIKPPWCMDQYAVLGLRPISVVGNWRVL